MCAYIKAHKKGGKEKKMRVVPWKDVKAYKPSQIPTWPVWVPKKRKKAHKKGGKKRR